MTNNTRVNDLQEKLLQAMDIINSNALKALSFDRTIVCTVEDDSNKDKGEYTVTDGSRAFAAYSTDTRLRVGESVYVTIPQWDFENQKIIVSKKIEEDDQPFIFTRPFDMIFDMTDTVIKGQSVHGQLIANALNKYGSNDYESVVIFEEECSYYGYTRLGLKANFKSWIKNAVRGNYGLLITLIVANSNTASSELSEQQEYHYIFSNQDMYGNSYAFETDYEQQVVVPLDNIYGTIVKIKVSFYQQANFFDKFNEPLPCSEQGFKLKDDGTNLYDRDEDGDYILNENDTLLEPNIFINDLYICFGYDMSIFEDDFIQIYTQNPITYKHSKEANNDGIAKNAKTIKMRWVHIENGVPRDMTNSEYENENYEIRWYRYQVGATAADPYCGVYWTRIENAKDFSYLFNPDVNKQQEKIKAIVLYNSNTPYRSNELIFENEEVLPPSAEAQHIMNALSIYADDNTNGNYLVYGQDNSIKDTAYGKETRSLSAYFDANSNGELEEQEIINETEAENLLWIFPANNTMLELLNEEKEEITEGVGDDKKILYYQIRTHAPLYKIASYYSPNKLNNTVICQYTLNGRVYKTEKEFSFGPAGTMGTDQTLIIDFVGDAKSVNLMDTANENVLFQVQLYDQQNISQDIPNGTVKWCWYYNSELEQQDMNIKFPYEITQDAVDETNMGNSVIVLHKEDFKIDHLYILQCTVGKLTTYFPIPIQRGDYSYIKGPTQVIYQSSGEPVYNREPYYLHTEAEAPQTNVKWRIIHHILANSEQELIQKERYIGEIDANTNKLLPLSIYTKDAPIYGVQAYNEGINSENQKEIMPLWTQPILVLQNQWPNGVINEWDGKSLVLDEKNSLVLATAMAAGKKNDDDNTFSGVMIGDWEEKDSEESLKQTGVYGFHHGAMSYAFKEDGTAFIGKSSMARINFDGSESTIYSAGYKQENSAGMMIDLYGNGTKPFIKLKSASGKSIMELSTEDQGSNIELKKDSGYIRITNNNGKNPLTIGSNFDVDWSGNIRAVGGTIGGWKISTTQLSSTDGNLVLDTENSGTILLKSDESLISGGTIAGSILSSTSSRDRRIMLDGYFELNGGGYIGEMESTSPGYTGDYGIGMAASESDSTTGIVKATISNAGLSCNYGSLSIDKDGTISMGFNEDGYFNIFTPTRANRFGLTGFNTSKNVIHTDIPAQNQFGIYARFA